MSSAGSPQEDVASPAAPDPAATVLYVCADRGLTMPALAAQRAEEEGRAFAEKRGLEITEVVTDVFGEPNPERRAGWQRVRELASSGAVASVLVRWPAALSPESTPEYRHRETCWLHEHGVRLRYTWAPLVSAGGGSQ